MTLNVSADVDCDLFFSVNGEEEIYLSSDYSSNLSLSERKLPAPEASSHRSLNRLKEK